MLIFSYLFTHFLGIYFDWKIFNVINLINNVLINLIGMEAREELEVPFTEGVEAKRCG